MYGAPSALQEMRNSELAEDGTPPSGGGEVEWAEPSPLGHAGRCPLLPLLLLSTAGEGGGRGDEASRWQLGECGLGGWQPGEAAASRERGAGVGSKKEATP